MRLPSGTNIINLNHGRERKKTYDHHASKGLEGFQRTHLGHIYQKLSVSGRRESVEKAKNLGII